MKATSSTKIKLKTICTGQHFTPNFEIIFNMDLVENVAVLVETMVASEFRCFREGQWQGTFLGQFPENAIADFPNCEPFNQKSVSKLNPKG